MTNPALKKFFFSLSSLSNSGQQVLFGMGNGQIRIQQLNAPQDLAQLGSHWTLSMHDNNYGHVTSIIYSFDGECFAVYKSMMVWKLFL